MAQLHNLPLHSEQHTIVVEGVSIVAHLFRPDGDGPFPCVVMAPGFSSTQDSRLHAYAQTFARGGVAAITFDYRHFGASEGMPRQVLSIKKQHADYKAVLLYARRLVGIDGNRMALWGSSFSGGHVLSLAAHDMSVNAVIAQVPFVDGRAALGGFEWSPKGLQTLRTKARLITSGGIDLAASVLGLPPYIVPAVGEPGSVSALNSATALQGMVPMAATSKTWKNEVAARVLLSVPLYRPIMHVHKIKVPVLYAVARYDDVTPAVHALAAAEKTPHHQIKIYNCGHFDPYMPPLFDTVAQDQLDFLKAHV